MGAQAVRLSNIDIDNALKNKDFEVLFQPIFDLGNGALARVESFVRWRHAMLGVLPPGAFISFFESQGRMSELTRYVLEQALQSYQDWRGANPPGFSINLALSDLSDDAFASHFDVLLRDSGFPADLITLECPMPPVTMEPIQAVEHFRRLAETGARLAIEARGRANDFLRQIEPLPFDEIKTGGAAILRFARTVRGPGLSAISELLDIAKKSNAAITAVGVEDQASLAALRSLGFAAAQGNHLAKVGPLSNFRMERVNEVRALLGLAPLDQAGLAALFRMNAPGVSAATRHAKKANQSATKESAGAATVGVESAGAGEEMEIKPALIAPADKGASLTPQQTRARPRSTLKRPVVSNATKAAAIARIKRKAAATASAAAPGSETEDAPAPAAARSLQEWLSREFRSDQMNNEFDFGDALAATEPEANPESPENFVAPNEPPHAAIKSQEPGENEQCEKAAASEKELAADAFEPAQPDSVQASDAPLISDDDRVAPDAFDLEEIEPVLIDAPPPMRPTPLDPDGVARAALAISGARAYFRPGVRVGVRDTSLPARHETARPPALEAPAPLTAAPESASENEDQASIVGEPAAPTCSPAPRRRRRKNFLTRKYRLWPTHFWPKSWKRAWRRHQARRTAERAAVK